MSRARLRDLGIQIGDLPTGLNNAITDVPGVTVGHTTLIHDEPSVARTGVTVVMPRGGQVQNDNDYRRAAYPHITIPMGVQLPDLVADPKEWAFTEVVYTTRFSIIHLPRLPIVKCHICNRQSNNNSEFPSCI